MSETQRPRFDPDIDAYYAHAPEESRLESGASRLESLRTRELIQRHLPPSPAIVLDVGGAAGAYAFWLAGQGYDVRLIDASSRLVELARQRNEKAAPQLRSCEVGDARDLSLANDSADIVLMLGPLYHLVKASDRLRALREAARVLRPGGIIVAAAISRLASVLDGMRREFLLDPKFASIVQDDLARGIHRNPTREIEYFTTSYFHRPEELRAELVEGGFEIDGLYGIEGPAWMLSDFEERWADARRREIVLDAARRLESDPSAIGCSAHLLAVGRKPGGR